MAAEAAEVAQKKQKTVQPPFAFSFVKRKDMKMIRKGNIHLKLAGLSRKKTDECIVDTLWD